MCMYLSNTFPDFFLCIFCSHAALSVFLFCVWQCEYVVLPYKVDSAKAAMANLSEVREKLLGVFFEEKLSHLRILQAPCPNRGGHPAECSPLSPTQRGWDYLGAEQHQSSWRFICGDRYA